MGPGPDQLEVADGEVFFVVGRDAKSRVQIQAPRGRTAGCLHATGQLLQGRQELGRVGHLQGREW